MSDGYPSSDEISVLTGNVNHVSYNDTDDDTDDNSDDNTDDDSNYDPNYDPNVEIYPIHGSDALDIEDDINYETNGLDSFDKSCAPLFHKSNIGQIDFNTVSVKINTELKKTLNSLEKDLLSDHDHALFEKIPSITYFRNFSEIGFSKIKTIWLYNKTKKSILIQEFNNQLVAKKKIIHANELVAIQDYKNKDNDEIVQENFIIIKINNYQKKVKFDTLNIIKHVNCTSKKY